MIRWGKMCDQIYGCANQYRCSIANYLMYFLLNIYQIDLDRAVDAPSHGKYVVGGLNAIHKQYLAPCLRMCSTPEVDNIDFKRMHADTMTKKGVVRFVEECKRLLNFSDEIGTKGDKKHAKKEVKAC